MIHHDFGVVEWKGMNFVRGEASMQKCGATGAGRCQWISSGCKSVLLTKLCHFTLLETGRHALVL